MKLCDATSKQMTVMQLANTIIPLAIITVVLRAIAMSRCTGSP